MHAVSLDLVGKLFFWSNALYVFGALLTLVSAGLIVYERRARSAARDFSWPVLKDSVILAPALICLLGTIAAICFSGMILNEQQASLETYKLQAAVELSRIHRDVEADSVAARRGQPAMGTAGTSVTGGINELGRAVTFEPQASAEPVRELGVLPATAAPLRSYEGMRAVVDSAPADSEASQFADHLLLLLIANGIDARQGKDSSVLHQLTGEPGIHIRYMDPDRGHDLAAMLAGLLRGQGLHVDVAPAWDLAARLEKRDRKTVTRDQVLVSIGPKS